MGVKKPAACGLFGLGSGLDRYWTITASDRSLLILSVFIFHLLQKFIFNAATLGRRQIGLEPLGSIALAVQYLEFRSLVLSLMEGVWAGNGCQHDKPSGTSTSSPSFEATKQRMAAPNTV